MVSFKFFLIHLQFYRFWKKKSYTHDESINLKYIWEFFSEFLDDPFSRNYAKNVKTNKFIVSLKIRLNAYLPSQNILCFES